jgi:hypothetical protein
MGDRKLLELAAKSAGIEILDGLQHDVTRIHLHTSVGSWNPLKDDADALRLAVKLGLDIDIHRRSPLSDSCGTEVRGYAYRRNMVTEPASDNDESLEAATRRAIVRAAAEIGKGI